MIPWGSSDWSGNGNHFTSSGTARPTFKTNRINGRPSVLADGVDDGLILSSFASKSAFTVMFVGCLVTYTGVVNILSVDDYAPDGIISCSSNRELLRPMSMQTQGQSIK